MHKNSWKSRPAFPQMPVLASLPHPRLGCFPLATANRHPGPCCFALVSASSRRTYGLRSILPFYYFRWNRIVGNRPYINERCKLLWNLEKLKRIRFCQSKFGHIQIFLKNNVSVSILSLN